MQSCLTKNEHTEINLLSLPLSIPCFRSTRQLFRTPIALPTRTAQQNQSPPPNPISLFSSAKWSLGHKDTEWNALWPEGVMTGIILGTSAIAVPIVQREERIALPAAFNYEDSRENEFIVLSRTIAISITAYWTYRWFRQLSSHFHVIRKHNKTFAYEWAYTENTNNEHSVEGITLFPSNHPLLKTRYRFECA